MTKNPCKDCEKRYLGCHSECEQYLDWKKAHQDAKDKMDADRRRGVLKSAKIQSHTGLRKLRGGRKAILEHERSRKSS